MFGIYLTISVLVADFIYLAFIYIYIYIYNLGKKVWGGGGGGEEGACPYMHMPPRGSASVSAEPNMAYGLANS